MRGLKKLALATIISTVPAMSYGMQPLNDTQLSGINGQDGATLLIDLPKTTKFNETIYDRGGIGNSASVNNMNTKMAPNQAGAIKIKGMTIHSVGTIKEIIDAGQANGSGNPVANISVVIPAGTSIDTGDIYIANTKSSSSYWDTSKETKLLDSSSITLGKVGTKDPTMNIQLANVPQTMTIGNITANPAITVTTALAGGMSINNFSLTDYSNKKIGGNNNDADLAADSIWLIDNNSGKPGTNLTGGDATHPGIGINITKQGLALGIGKMGTGDGINQYITNLSAGTSDPVGDLAITGLNLDGGHIVLAGHKGDGLTEKLYLPDQNLTQIIYDRDGGNGQYNMASNKAGALIIENMKVSTHGNPITLMADAGQDTANNPVLNLNVKIPGGSTIDTGDLYIGTTNYIDVTGASGGNRTSSDWAVTKDPHKLMSSSSIQLGETGHDSYLNIQLGNVPQTMTDGNSGTWNPAIALKTTIHGGMTMSNFALTDYSTSKIGVSGTASSADLAADSIWMIDNNAGKPGDNLTGDDGNKAGLGINVTKNGLALGIGKLGTGDGINQYITNLKAGSKPAVGDMAMIGLDLNGASVIMKGHEGGGLTGTINLPFDTASTYRPFNQVIYDRDGIGGSSSAGALVLKDMRMSTSGNGLVLKADAGTSKTDNSKPVFNLHLTVDNTSSLNIHPGDLYLAKANGTTDNCTSGTWVTCDETGPVLTTSNDTVIKLTDADLNLQLGNVPQQMTFNSQSKNPAATLTATAKNGIEMKTLQLHDTSSNAKRGLIQADSIKLTDTGGSDLSATLAANVTDDGLVLGVKSLGSASGVNETINNLRVCDSAGSNCGAPVGNLVIHGLNINGATITIAGH